MLQIGDYVRWNRQSGFYTVVELINVDEGKIVKIEDVSTKEAHLTNISNLNYLACSEKYLINELDYDELVDYFRSKGDTDPISTVVNKMKQECSDEFGVPLDIIDILYPTAYEYGHSNGIRETYNYLTDLCEVAIAVVEHIKKGGTQ